MLQFGPAHGTTRDKEAPSICIEMLQTRCCHPRLRWIAAARIPSATRLRKPMSYINKRLIAFHGAMANTHQVPSEQLEKTIEQHSNWYGREMMRDSGVPFPAASTPDPNPRACLVGINFQGVDLRKRLLSKADLVHCDMRGVHLEGTFLQGAAIQDCLLLKGNLNGAILNNSTVSDCAFAEADLEMAMLDGAHISETGFQHANLKGAYFARANLEEVLIENCQMQKVVLVEAVVKNSSIAWCDLTGGELARATFTECKVDGTRFQDANLQDADLSNVHGLTTENIAGANVSGARLPDEIKRFDGLPHVSELSRQSKNLFLLLLGTCIYTLLTAATFAGADLQSEEYPILPIIALRISPIWFLSVAPAILFLVYVYFQLLLHRLWDAVSVLPAVFSDGRALDEAIYPWLLTGIIRPYYPRLRDREPTYGGVQRRAAWLLGWWLTPGSLAVLSGLDLYFGARLPFAVSLILCISSVVVGAHSAVQTGKTLRDKRGAKKVEPKTA